MMCWAGRLYLEQNMERIELEIEVQKLEEHRAQLQGQTAQIEQEMADERKRLEEENAKYKAELDARTADIESQLKQRQDDFQNWDLVVHRYFLKQEEAGHKDRRPDVHLYVRRGGIYRDGRKAKLSDGEIRAWLIEEAAAAEQNPYGYIVVATWQENGANDSYIRLLDIFDRTRELQGKVAVHNVVLPDGVRADASQKGN